MRTTHCFQDFHTFQICFIICVWCRCIDVIQACNNITLCVKVHIFSSSIILKFLNYFRKIIIVLLIPILIYIYITKKHNFAETNIVFTFSDWCEKYLFRLYFCTILKCGCWTFNERNLTKFSTRK